MEHYLASEFHRQQAARRAPAYQHLRRALQHAIENGELPAGQALPGERELGKQLGLSRVTVRKAIAGLKGGARVRVLSTDPMSVIDIPHFCQEAGHKLISRETDNDEVHIFLLERA